MCIRDRYHTNVPEEIEKRCSKKAAAINDAKAAGLCEFRLGNARDAESSVCILIGTGIGGCYCDRNGVVQMCIRDRLTASHCAADRDDTGQICDGTEDEGTAEEQCYGCVEKFL